MAVVGEIDDLNRFRQVSEYLESGFGPLVIEINEDIIQNQGVMICLVRW